MTQDSAGATRWRRTFAEPWLKLSLASLLRLFCKSASCNRFGMVDTGFRVSDEQVDRFAACYMRLPDKRLILEDDPETSHYRHKRNFFSGGGGLVGTTTDYMAFCEMLRQGGQYNGYQLLGRRTLELMTAKSPY
jgi:CubicO group peptidase (beta-lactamase class C family)